jgi:hypothetical protein
MSSWQIPSIVPEFAVAAGFWTTGLRISGLNIAIEDFGIMVIELRGDGFDE